MSNTILPPAQDTEILDASTRVIVVRALSAMERFRVIKAVGAGENGRNEPYLGMCMLIASVRSIDGVPTPPVQNDKTIEAILNQLGDVGWSAVEFHYANEASDSTADVVSDAKN